MCKAIFDRPKDWVDIEEILDWGTSIDGEEILVWVGQLLGADSEQHARLVSLLATSG